MTTKMLNLVMNEIAAQARAITLSQCPIDTGRMLRSVKIVYHEDGFSIIVPEEIFYFKFTDEPWERQSGKTNPNEGWFSERVYGLISKMIQSRLGGSLTKLE